MKLGVTVGKFNPFHKGHSWLISYAETQCDELVVIVGDRGTETIPSCVRANWVKQEHPNVKVVITRDDLPDAPEPWARRTLQILGCVPDVAFTSETYGPGWAQAMGTRHDFGDLNRTVYPVSGTELRKNVGEHWDMLTGAAKATLTKRVVLVGAESTGTTTLARTLAEYYETPWVNEYGRTWWENRRHLADDSWNATDFQAIVAGQIQTEDMLARKANKVLICDTDALVTMVFEERYRGFVSAHTKKISEARVPDLYIITGDEIAWHQDGTRESFQEREQMQQQMRELVHTRNCDAIEVSGTVQERMRVATDVIDTLLIWEPLT